MSKLYRSKLQHCAWRYQSSSTLHLKICYEGRYHIKCSYHNKERGEKTLECFISINLWMFSILQTIGVSLICYFMLKVWLSQWKLILSTLSVKSGVSRMPTRHFNDDHLQYPQDTTEFLASVGLWACLMKRYLMAPGVGSVLFLSPQADWSAHLPWFQQLQSSPACREWNIYWVRRLSVLENACQCVLPLRVWGNFYALW